jgi:hypothetical protein
MCDHHGDGFYVEAVNLFGETARPRGRRRRTGPPPSGRRLEGCEARAVGSRRGEMEGKSERPTSWDALFDALLDDAGALTRRIRERLQADFAVYRSIPAAALERSLEAQLVRILSAARAGRDAVSGAEVAELAEIGESRAQQGVPIEVVLWGWRVGIELLIDRARTLGAGLEVAPGRVLDFIQSLLAWADLAMLTIAAAHQQAELELARREQEHRADLVRGALFGALAPAEMRGQLESYGVDPRREYVAVRARPADRTVERALGFHEAIQHRRGLSAIVDGDLVGFLRERPASEPPGVVGVGPPRALDRLAESFRLATRALVTADAFGLTGTFDIAQLGLRPAVIADSDVGDALRRRYLEPLDATRSAAEVTASLRAYFESGQHIERAAARLFVHPNTLRYRLGRFEEMTGASLRDPVVAFELWWALERESIRA